MADELIPDKPDSGNPHSGFMTLQVWQEARIFKNYIRELTRKFPAEEKYRLTDQIIRSSRSINSNISEGHGRRTFRDQHHFCIQARGSLSETLNHLYDALDEEIIDNGLFNSARIQYKKVEALLNGYIAYLRSRFT